MSGAGLYLELALGHIFRQDTQEKLGALFGKGVADESNGERPDFVDAIAGLIQGIGFFVIAVGVELGVGADICAEYLDVA